MEQAEGWARLWATSDYRMAPHMRRGGWYPVVDNADLTTVLIDTPAQTQRIPRGLVEVRMRRPDRFTVVYRPADDPNPVAGTPKDLGSPYVVCPQENCRVRLIKRSPLIVCPKCGHQGEVAWWETG